MIGKTNSGIILGIINVTCPFAATVTLTQSGKGYRFTQTGENTSFKLPNAGTWNIKAEYNGISVNEDVTITPGEVKAVTMMKSVVLFNRDTGTYADGFTSGFTNGTSIQANQSTTTKTSNSNGQVNLTGYKHVYATLSGEMAIPPNCISKIGFYVLHGSSTVASKTWEPAQSAIANTVTVSKQRFSLNVASSTDVVKFRLRAQSSLGDGTNRKSVITLHKLELDTE